MWNPAIRKLSRRLTPASGTTLRSLVQYRCNIGAISAQSPIRHFVIPAQAGIQFFDMRTVRRHWIPACAGMTRAGMTEGGILKLARRFPHRSRLETRYP